MADIKTSSDYVKFHSNAETDIASYKNRVLNLYEYNKLTSESAVLHGFKPTSDLKAFLRLKAIDKELSDDVVASAKNLAAPETETLTTEEGKRIRNIVEGMQAEQFVQLFLDRYMSPYMSDIDYRLGKVTASKIYATDAEGNVTYEHWTDLSQYDSHGRMDTAVNLRTVIDIDGVGESMSNGFQVIPSYKEYYVNWFFPPFRRNMFDDDTTLSKSADELIKNRKWNSKTQQWVYDGNENFDLDKYTFDTKNYLSLRKNPTYRKTAYKSINDNIMLLQKVFENTTGIVSTYLTEWDISLYIQEGLLSDNSKTLPSMLGLMNRITKDNPTGLTGSNAFVYGALNAAVSKTPLGTPIPNTSLWNPSAHPLSTYWWPYKSVNRGDGLDEFYDSAKGGFMGSNFDSITFKKKIEFYDGLGAAYSGWYNWDVMPYWSALYTTQYDEFSGIDIIHMSENTDARIFETVNDSSGEEVEGVIDEIINYLHDNDDSLGYPEDEWEEVTSIDRNYDIIKSYKRDKRTGNAVLQGWRRQNKNKPYNVEYFDAAGNPKDSSTSVSSEGDISVMGCPIPGSSLLKLFLKKDSIKSKVMKVADKASGKNYSNASSGASGLDINVDSSGNVGLSYISNSENADTKASLEALDKVGLKGLFDIDDAENGQYSRHEGVDQWAPALYGGPHGRYYSPNTIQGYFEEDNEFYRNIPRVNAKKLPRFNSEVSNASQFYQGNEKQYNVYNTDIESDNRLALNAGRSPSRCINFLTKGQVDYTMHPLVQLVKSEIWMYDNVTMYYNGHYLNYTGEAAWMTEDIDTGFLTATTGINLNYGYANFCSCYYSPYDKYGYENAYYSYYYSNTKFYEWENYYRYRSGGFTFYKVPYETYTGTRKAGYTTFYGRHTYYKLRKIRTVLKHRAYYYSWQTVYYKRPLMHSNINAHWTINKGWENTFTVKPTWWSSPASAFIRWVVGLFTSWRPAPVVELTSRKEVYRLVMPSRTSDVSYTTTTNDNDFITNILGNTTPNKEGKHYVYFFGSRGGLTERLTNGPDIIFRAGCKMSTYTYKYQVVVWYSYRHRCHRDWAWRYEWRVATDRYIQVELPDSVLSQVRMGNTKGNIWNNLSKTQISSKQEVYEDVPTTLEMPNFYMNPSSIEENVGPSAYNAPHYWKNTALNSGEVGIHGWGYSACLPGFEIQGAEPPEMFEDPNDYLNYNNLYSNATDRAIKDLQVPFYKLDTNNLVYMGGNHNTTFYSKGVKGYTRVNADAGLKKFFLRLYTTSTFFKYDETGVATRDRPTLVSNDSQIRTLAKVANHQKAWLKYALDLFVNSVDFKEVLKLLVNTVDTSILARSLPTSKAYDRESTLYHPWIEKAAKIFSSADQKQKIAKEFQTRIDYLQTFVDSVAGVIGRTVEYWSYNELVNTYKQANSLYTSISSNMSIEEYMYAYLNVLYEYRKFFINKRCNKIDGTLWQLRALEGVIPAITTNIQTLNEFGDSVEEAPATAGGIHTYKVDYYDVQNSNYDKARAEYTNDESLDEDRTMTLYFKVKYVSEKKARAYLDKVKSGTDTLDDTRIMYIPDEFGGQGKYAEVPFDGLYRYISKEYLKNEATKTLNSKFTKAGLTSLVEPVADIDECVFNINWIYDFGGYSKWNTDKTVAREKIMGMGNNEFINGTSLKKSGLYYPYIYTEPTNSNDVRIQFGVHSGINPVDLAALAKIDSAYSGLDALCATQTLTDYWVVKIPRGKMPRTAGYISNLKIQTFVEKSKDNISPTPGTPATGVFSYMLYPITEEQANTIPGIGTDMTATSEKLREALS